MLSIYFNTSDTIIDNSLLTFRIVVYTSSESLSVGSPNITLSKWHANNTQSNSNSMAF